MAEQKLTACSQDQISFPEKTHFPPSHLHVHKFPFPYPLFFSRPLTISLAVASRELRVTFFGKKKKREKNDLHLSETVKLTKSQTRSVLATCILNTFFLSNIFDLITTSMCCISVKLVAVERERKDSRTHAFCRFLTAPLKSQPTESLTNNLALQRQLQLIVHMRPFVPGSENLFGSANSERRQLFSSNRIRQTGRES